MVFSETLTGMRYSLLFSVGPVPSVVYLAKRIIARGSASFTGEPHAQVHAHLGRPALGPHHIYLIGQDWLMAAMLTSAWPRNQPPSNKLRHSLWPGAHSTRTRAYMFHLGLGCASGNELWCSSW